MSDSTSTGATSAKPPATVDVQDPLPEIDWFWRRIYTYVVSIVLILLIAYVLYGLRGVQDADGLLEIGLRLCWLLGAVITFYLVAPSAEQIVHLVQAARTLRAGVPMSRVARVESPDGTMTEASSTAGKPGRSPPPVPSPAAPAPTSTVPPPTEIME